MTTLAEAKVILWYRAQSYALIHTILSSLPDHIQERCYSYRKNLTDWVGMPETARCAFRNHYIRLYALND